MVPLNEVRKLVAEAQTSPSAQKRLEDFAFSTEVLLEAAILSLRINASLLSLGNEAKKQTLLKEVIPELDGLLARVAEFPLDLQVKLNPALGKLRAAISEIQGK